MVLPPSRFFGIVFYMNRESVSKKIKKAVHKIVRNYKPQKIILFGSYAWGKPTENSDVDLLVVKNSKKRKSERAAEIRRKIFPTDIPLDILVYTPKEIERRLAMKDFFFEDILTKGRSLYEKQKT